MFYTETEAREKACPFARAIEAIQPSGGEAFAAGVNRSLDSNLPDDVRNNPPFCRCIGSDCMMWAAGHYNQKPDGTMTPATDTGFCGLAGSAVGAMR